MAAEGKRGLIIGAAPWKDSAFLAPYLKDGQWMVFCADGGYANACAAGLKPDFLIGDWDSGSRPELDVPCVTLPVEKDMTDLQAAMDEALSVGISQLLLCGKGHSVPGIQGFRHGVAEESSQQSKYQAKSC